MSIDHKGGIDTVNRNLVTSNVKWYKVSPTTHCYLHFGALRTFHQTDHAVLRSLVAGDDPLSNLDYAVSLHQSCLF